MGAHIGVNTVEDGLVFAYDMGDPFVSKSWKGEPTTNVLPSPSVNGRFNTGNGWGTYNTNQYNGAAFFSIGTIASVSSNLITTTTAHPLRTFDVVRPQTTGGGVTANVDYFVKKVSDTSFTLHAYNSSQDGSQGYILPSGFHKVHENIATDTRVSVNSTNFPTMWWGAPHLPNSGLVKEIVSGQGRFKGTNAMRLHITRTVGIDGMAYGVNTPATTGDEVFVSYWARTNNPGINFNYQRYQGPGQPYYSRSDGLTADWQYITHTWTASNTYSFIQYWFPPASTGPYWVDMADLQVEINTQSGSTPFTLSSRSNTESLLDWTGNNTIIPYATYDSDGTFSFNGSSNYIDLGTDITVSPTNQGWTAEYWFNTNSASTLQHFNSAEADDFNANWLALLNSKLAVWNVSPGYWKYGDTVIQSNTWYQGVFVCYPGGTTMRFYINGEAEGGDHVANSWVSAYSALKTRYVGRYEYNGAYSRYWNGKIASTRMYNRALTAAEVSQNFQALRGRYGV